MTIANPFLQGTLDLLILKSLITGPRHGYSVMRWIRDTSEGEVDIQEGALYPALHRMEEKGWLESEWGASESNRRARFYKLTPEGRRYLRIQTKAWGRHGRAVTRILEAT